MSGTSYDDAPLAPPAEVLRRIPATDSFGPHNCEGHRHSLERLPESDDPVVPHSFMAHLWSCDGCDGYENPVAMHALPCGHVLCLVCVTAKVTKVPELMTVNRGKLLVCRRMLDEAAWKLKKGQQEQQQGRTAVDPPALHCVRALMEHLHINMLSLLGLTCCGRSSSLWRYRACMPPPTAALLWRVRSWLATPMSHWLACGWPDCGAYIPPACWYRRGDVGCTPEWRYWCPTCRANSQGCGGVVERDQDEFPLLPAGHPRLMPAR